MTHFVGVEGNVDCSSHSNVCGRSDNELYRPIHKTVKKCSWTRHRLVSRRPMAVGHCNWQWVSSAYWIHDWITQIQTLITPNPTVILIIPLTLQSSRHRRAVATKQWICRPTFCSYLRGWLYSESPTIPYSSVTYLPYSSTNLFGSEQVFAIACVKN